MATPPDPLQIELFDHVARGELWTPEGRPNVPAAWIRDLVVTGKAHDTAVHSKGVRVKSVTLTGVLDFEGATLKVPLMLDDVDIGEPVNLELAHGGEVRITGSRLARFCADQLHLEHSLDLSKSTINGPVKLTGSKIGGDLDCSGATFLNAEGPEGYVLAADRMQVDGSVFLADRFYAEGAVRLSSAKIGANLECTGGTFLNPNGSALFGQALTVTGGLLWRRMCDVSGEVFLQSAQVGSLVDDQRSWQFEDMTYRLEGFRVDGFEGVGARWKWQERKDWLDNAHEPRTSSYEMVARWYRSAGREQDARHIGIAKQDARTANLHKWPKRFHKAWRLLARYGYQPWRAVLVLLVIYAVGVAVFASSDMILAQTIEVYGFNSLVYSADVVVPLVDLKQATQWAPADTFGLVTMWLLIISGWVLSLALVAAVSVLYTKD